jgi:hypothetical protein
VGGCATLQHVSRLKLVVVKAFKAVVTYTQGHGYELVVMTIAICLHTAGGDKSRQAPVEPLLAWQQTDIIIVQPLLSTINESKTTRKPPEWGRWAVWVGTCHQMLQQATGRSVEQFLRSSTVLSSNLHHDISCVRFRASLEEQDAKMMSFDVRKA